MIGAAGCVAAAQKAFDKTLRYATERQAFGRPIGHFQVIRHKFAEMATEIEAARQLVYTTAWRFANGEYPVREISMAKVYAARMACRVTDECLQIHGGAGYMKEYGIERVVARHAAQPDRRRDRRDHARGDRALVRALAGTILRLDTDTGGSDGRTGRQGGDRHRLGARDRPRDGRAAEPSTARRS